MKYEVYTSALFRKSFNRLDPAIQVVVDETLETLRTDFRETISHPHKNFTGLMRKKGNKRKTWRTRCWPTQFRLAWEWLKSGDIGLWEVGTHDEIDNFKPKHLPSEGKAQWILVEEPAQNGVITEEIPLEDPQAQLPDVDGAGILDYLVDLSPAQKDLVHVNATGPLLIRGVAGSGKTTLGLHRAQSISRLRAQLGQETSILILTFTRTLKTTLEYSFADSFPDLPASVTIDIDSFGDWMVKRLQQSGGSIFENKNSRDYIRRIRAEVAASHPQGETLSGMSSRFILDEIDDVLRGRDIGSLEEYKQIKRSGRRKGLNQSRRELVWIVYQQYQEGLRELNKFDWAELPQLVVKHCRPLPQYDVVIVDEAQDLRPNYLNLATKLIRDYKDYRSLTLFGDLAQSIHYPGVSWRDAGLPLTGGRTRLVTQNHRNTRQIMDVALPILDKCRSLGSVRRYHSPERIERNGEKPILVRYTSLELVVDYIAGEINAQSQKLELKYSNFAILSPRKMDNSELFRALKKRLPESLHFRDDDFMVEDDKVALITMHSAKGLEFPVVFIIDFEGGIIPYEGPSSASPHEIEERARKLAYVSMTRATQRLYIIYPKSNPSPFVHDILDANENAVRILNLQ